MVLLYISLVLISLWYTNGISNVAVCVLVPKRQYKLPLINDLLKAWAHDFSHILFISQKEVITGNSSIRNKRSVDLEYDWDYFEAFSRISKEFPKRDWYIVVEYNTAINTNWLHRSIASLDPNKIHLLGTKHPHSAKFIRFFDEDPASSYIWGGTGITASAATVTNVILSKKCQRFYQLASRVFHGSGRQFSYLIKIDEIISLCVRRHEEREPAYPMKDSFVQPEIFSIFGRVTFNPALLSLSRIIPNKMGEVFKKSLTIEWSWSRYCRDFTSARFNKGLSEDQVIKRLIDRKTPEYSICIDAKNVENKNFFEFLFDHPKLVNSNMSTDYSDQLKNPILQSSVVQVCYNIPGFRLASDLRELIPRGEKKMSFLVNLKESVRNMFRDMCSNEVTYFPKEKKEKKEIISFDQTLKSQNTIGCLHLLIFGITKGGSSSLSSVLKTRFGYIGPVDGMFSHNTETMHCVPFLSPCTPVLPTPSTSVFGDFNRSYSVYRSLVEQCFSCGFQKGYLQMFPFQHKTCQRLSDKWDLSVEDAKGKLRRFDGVLPTQARLIEKQPDALMFPHLAEYYFRLYLENKFNYNSSMRMESISNFKLQHDDLGLKRIDGMQLMLVLRDPVTRLFSHFNHYQKALTKFDEDVLTSSLLSLHFDTYVDKFLPFALKWRNRILLVMINDDLDIKAKEYQVAKMWIEMIYSVCSDVGPKKRFNYPLKLTIFINKKKMKFNEDWHDQCSLKRGLIQGFYFPQLLHWIHRFSQKDESINDRMMVILYESLYGNDTKRREEFKRIEKFLYKKPTNYDPISKLLQRSKDSGISNSTSYKLYELYRPLNEILFHYLDSFGFLQRSYIDFWN